MSSDSGRRGETVLRQGMDVELGRSTVGGARTSRILSPLFKDERSSPKTEGRFPEDCPGVKSDEDIASGHRRKEAKDRL